MPLDDRVSKESSPSGWAEFDPDPSRSLFYLACRSIFDLLIRIWFRPRIVMTEKIPSRGAVILAPVHRSWIDFAFTALVTRRKLFFMAKDSIWRHRLLGRLLLLLGVFPVDRDGVDRTSFERAQLVLKRGQVLVIFPEGTRREGSRVENLYEGVALLSARSTAPVYPIGIGGSDKAMPKGTLLPRPRTVQVVCGPQIAPPSKNESGRAPRSSLRAMTDRLAYGIQIVYDEARERDGASFRVRHHVSNKTRAYRSP